MKKIRLATIFMTLFLILPLRAPTAFGQEDSSKAEAQLSPLQKIDDLEQAAKSVRVTIEKCEATAGAYADTPTAQLIESISDKRLHDLNIESFACMRLGGRGARYGYQIKNIVDAASAAQVIRNVAERQQKETSKVASDLLAKVVDHNNALVDKYNNLAVKYNALLGAAQAMEKYADRLQYMNSQMYALAAQALGAAWYSRPVVVEPSIPSTIYVQQSPLHCTTQTMPATVPGLSKFAYTNCF